MIKLRAHHVMCVHGFKGHGYSPGFVKNFWKVLDRLKDSSIEAQIEIVPSTTDDICLPCPNNLGQVCKEEDRIQTLDHAYIKTLGLYLGQTMSWSTLKKMIATQVTDDDFEKNCEPCGWKNFGVCKTALSDLRKDAMGLSVLLALSMLGLGVVGLQPNAFCADAVPTPSASEMPSPFATADVLEQRILNDKTRRVPAIKKAFDAIQKKNFSAAIQAAKSLEFNADYSDYFQYLSGLAENGRMHALIQSKKTANATLAGEQAVFHLMQVPGSNAYTSLEKRATTLVGDTEVSLGEVYLKLGKRAKALQKFENGFQRFSQVNALSFVPKRAIVTYALMCEKKVNDLCMSWVTRLAPVMGKGPDAKVVERIAAVKRTPVDKTTQTQYRVDLDLQAFQKGFSLYLDGKYEAAADVWYDLLKEYPRTTIKLRTKFWLARAAQKTKHDAQAETLFRQIIRELPFSYYALLSSWMGGIDLSRMLDAEVPMATTDSPNLTPSEITHIRRAESLIATGVPELAQLELQSIKPSSNMSNEFLVYLALLHHLATNHLAAFQVFGELSARNYQGLFSSYGEKMFFPKTFFPEISVAAKEQGVDPLIVLSIIKQESAFNPHATSVANAYGLMQIIAPTARDLDPNLDGDLLFQPKHNVRLGSKYIGQLLKRYKGNLVRALSAYNAGPGNSDRWQREAPPNLSPEEYIELIGFRETREYVQNITRNLYWYNRLTKGESAPNISSVVLTR